LLAREPCFLSFAAPNSLINNSTNLERNGWIFCANSIASSRVLQSKPYVI
jgi:hypothetical protein